MDSDTLPTRIVILKPNIGKFSHSLQSPPSPASGSLLSDRSSQREFPGFGYEDNEQNGRRKLSCTMDLGLPSKGAQEISEEINMKIKNEYDSGSPTTFTLKTRPYVESSKTREAKRKLSRPWNMTHRSHEFNFGGTLVDMLSIPDQTASGLNADSGGAHHLSAACDVPLGISSRDG
ncbi:hypothetical protein SAY87_022770 [Trapa incisa]|uniref:Uncharacterized protein n=1 Tax=Trapa incisa TaxID=236973 RepID=A0AAN7K4P4_9MYRT|nr:hypothetical protein SAY87_022770 [Trapa incisa]